MFLTLPGKGWGEGGGSLFAVAQSARTSANSWGQQTPVIFAPERMLASGGHQTQSPLSTCYSAGYEKWSEVKWKRSEVKWSESEVKKVKSIFGPLIFFNLRYIKVGVWGNKNIDIKKCTTIFLWVWYFGEVGEIFKNFQKHPLGESFWKMGSKVIFGKILQEISL